MRLALHWQIDGRLQLRIRLLLDSLRVLELLYQLHLQHLHLHDLGLLLPNHLLLLSYFPGNLLACLFVLDAPVLLDLGLLDLFLLFLDLVFHHFLLMQMLVLLPVLILMLFRYKLALLGLLFLMKHNGILDLLRLHISLLLHDLYVMPVLLLPLLLRHLQLHLLLRSLLVLGLQAIHIIRPLLRLLYLLPRLHLLLLQESNSVG